MILVKQPIGQPETVLVHFKPGFDILSSFTTPDPTSGTDYYFTKYGCRAKTGQAFKVVALNARFITDESTHPRLGGHRHRDGGVCGVVGGRGDTAGAGHSAAVGKRRCRRVADRVDTDEQSGSCYAVWDHANTSGVKTVDALSEPRGAS